MSKLMELRIAAREIFEDALRALDPAAAMGNAVRPGSSSLTICDTGFEFAPEADVYSVAIGKAAVPMGSALEEVLGDRIANGVIAAPIFNVATHKLGERWERFEGGHPVPNEHSLAAAKAALASLDRANQQKGLVIFLISGGGSAMLEWPISDDITLEDLQSANQTLVNCGASISEINAVRRSFSAVKGGRLAMHAPNCQQVTLIVSDVPAGEEYNVASGPTLTPPTDALPASEVFAHYGLRTQLPSSIIRAIECPTPQTPRPNRHEYFILLDNEAALKAVDRAARKRGFNVEIPREISDEPIEAGCEKILTSLVDVHRSAGHKIGADMCLLSGGEFTCPIRGDGIGGRNLETALRLAIAADQASERVGDFVALCAGTDGIDGNSPAAGAIVDNTTIERARKIGLDPTDFLDRSDAYSFFVALGDAITTGPTGTNVRDLRILLTSSDATR